MLEIAFDETQGDSFWGEKRKTADCRNWSEKSWPDLAAAADDFLQKYGNESIVIVCGLTDKDMFRAALMLGVAAYEEKTNLETVVFKTLNSKHAFEAFRPYMALSNALRYARDLFRMNDKDMWADIGRLGYLGILCDRDYQTGRIILRLNAGTERKIILSAKSRNEAIALIGIMKMQAICKNPVTMEGIIGDCCPETAEMLPEIVGENGIIETIISYCEREL